MFHLTLFKKISLKKYISFDIYLGKKKQSEFQKIYLLFETTTKNIKLGKYRLCKIIPRSEFNSWTMNVLKICKTIGLENIKKVIRGYIYLCDSDEEMNTIFKHYHDPLTEYFYTDSFKKKNKTILSKEAFLELDDQQTNSEHSRHHFFSGNIKYANGKKTYPSLFELVKEPSINLKNTNSVLAFCDNSSSIKGFKTNLLMIKDKQYVKKEKMYNFTLTAETHNFPTGVCPFPGAATGIGGRIRDGQSAGRGSIPVAGTAGYCVGEIFDKNSITEYPLNIEKPVKILIKGSNGASDYGNKFGEPIIGGFTRSFRKKILGQRYEWVKPIMFTGGIGIMDNLHNFKQTVKKGMYICKIGGPAYPIGLGGSHASSRISDSKNIEYDFNAVQRADPEMEQRMNRVIRHCVELGKKNPILSIHDQGAGGNANVLKEIIEDCGADIDLGKITLGDKNMNLYEIWLSEYQESNALLTYDIDVLKDICRRENVNLDILGKTNGTGKLNLYYKSELILDKYDYKAKEKSNKTYFIQKSFTETIKPEFISKNIEKLISKTFSDLSVCSKRFLTNKVDRSVTGLIAQQQCVGPKHTPLSNYSMISTSFFKNKDKLFNGCVSSIGEQPIIGIIDSKAMVDKTFSEALLNIIWVYIGNIQNIKMSVNWMWPCPNTDPKEGYKMYKSMEYLNKIMNFFGVVADGGKDSLSMVCKHESEYIKSPGSMVLSMYAPCPDIHKKVSPVINVNKSDNKLYYISLSRGNMRMGNSKILKNENVSMPGLENYQDLLYLFEIIQLLIKKDILLSGHDISDGGLITTLCEMAFCSEIGLDINISSSNYINYLFNEEIGIVIQIKQDRFKYVSELFYSKEIPFIEIAKINSNKNEIKISNFDEEIYVNKMTTLRKKWESTSSKLELLQCNSKQVNQEIRYLSSFTKLNYIIPNNLKKSNFNVNKSKYKVGLIRAEGSNGDRELAAAFNHAGFSVIDINTQDIINNEVNFSELNGLAFCGGFSYSDVLGSAKGWFLILDKYRHYFDEFFNRKDTFSIGICNGCQLMSRLGLIDAELVRNNSNRFESRFPTLKVVHSENIFLKDMKDLSFGMWSAHGEGKFKFYNYRESKKNIAIQYVNNNHKPTEMYPYNPNGSEFGTAALSSNNNRHLAIMPHPERCFLKWQIPWSSEKIQSDFTPWFKLFTNARKWLDKIYLKK